MIKLVKETHTLIELIYSLEPICYYFKMKPNEFWNSTYREISIYIQANLCNLTDDFKKEIKLYEASTDKIIMADAMSNKRPQIIPLQKTFKNLFADETTQTPEEIARRMRSIMQKGII